MTTVRSFILVILALGVAAAVSSQAPTAGYKTFRGEIADTQCALNVHSLNKSHKEMMDMRPDLKTNADCARFCVRERGGKFVFQSGDNVYRLDKIDQAEPFAGQQVKIGGILDPKTNTIAVRSITPIGTTRPGSDQSSLPN